MQTTARSLPRRPTILSVLSVLLLAVCATLRGPLGTLSAAHAVSNTCPGGSNSGEGSSSSGTCPNLHNRFLGNQPTMPLTVYRGDSRSPSDIFSHGFTAFGSNDDLVAHVHGQGGDSNYISTTGTLGVSETFARRAGMGNLDRLAGQPRCSTARMAFYALIPGLGNYLLSSCVHGTVTARTFIYEIDTRWARNAMYVPSQLATLGRQDMVRTYQNQDEWAYVHHSPNYAIRGVRIYETTAHETNGRIDFGTLTFRSIGHANNPNHVAPRVVLQPVLRPERPLQLPDRPGRLRRPGESVDPPVHRGQSLQARLSGGAAAVAHLPRSGCLPDLGKRLSERFAGFPDARRGWQGHVIAAVLFRTVRSYRTSVRHRSLSNGMRRPTRRASPG